MANCHSVTKGQGQCGLRHALQVPMALTSADTVKW